MRYRVLIVLLALVAGLAFADDLPADADALFELERWDEAAAAYLERARADASDARSWLRLGLAQLYGGNAAAAVTALERADQLGFAPQWTRTRLALAHAELGSVERALAWLSGAVDAGYADVEALTDDAEFAPLRRDPGFAALVRRADRNARPCEYEPTQRQFDFWVGEWDVFDAQGTKVGSNSITKAEQGCLLIERWSGVGGSSGHSINFFHPARRTWQQLWVSASGSVISAEGEFRDGAMRLNGENVARDGSKELSRGVWTPLPDGRVRQTFEQSRDDGASWYVWFDGYYVRVGGE